MEALLKKLILLVLFMFIISARSNAQDFKAVNEAFTSSYTYENAAEYGKAIDVMKRIYDEKSYEINIRLGWLYYMSGLFTEAQTYYQRSISLRPLSLEAKFGFILPSSALGNWDKVITQYASILKIDPSNTTANYRLGLIYYGRKNYTMASKHFEKIVNLYPFDYDGIHMYAWTNYHLKKSREAKILFQKGLLIRPGDASCLEGLSLIK